MFLNKYEMIRPILNKLWTRLTTTKDLSLCFLFRIIHVLILDCSGYNWDSLLFLLYFFQQKYFNFELCAAGTCSSRKCGRTFHSAPDSWQLWQLRLNNILFIYMYWTFSFHNLLFFISEFVRMMTSKWTWSVERFHIIPSLYKALILKYLIDMCTYKSNKLLKCKCFLCTCNSTLQLFQLELFSKGINN